MTRLRALCAAVGLALWGAVSGAAQFPVLAQDAPAQGEVEIAVREGMTLLDPGRPVTDALAAYVDPGWGTQEAAGSAARADGNGRIRLPFQGEGGTVLVWAPGRAPVGLRVGKPLPFDVLLAPGPAPEVRVTNAAGESVADAEVLVEAVMPLQRAADLHVYRVAGRTDGSGRVAFPGVPDVSLSVTAHADGFVDATVFPVDPRRGATVVLGRGSRVSGTLVLAPGGAPAKGATARLGPRTVHVSDDGAFTFETVPPGPWVLTFDGPGFAPPAARTLVLRDGADRGGLEFTAARTSEFRAHAVAPEGRVVTAVRATFVYPPHVLATRHESFAVVGIGGGISIPDLPPADGVAVVLESPGWMPVRIEGVSLPSGGSSLVLLAKFAAGAGLTGVILDLEGLPVADATIVATSSEPPTSARDTGRGVTLADGSFAFDGLPAGNAWVRLIGRPVGSGTSFGPFVVKADDSTDAGTLKAFAGWTLDGRVPGAPDGTTVVASIAGAASNAGDLLRADVVAESFKLSGLPAGPFELRAEQNGDVVGRTTVSLPSAWQVTVPYGPPVMLRGRLRDEAGRAVTGATVRAARIDGVGRRDVLVSDPAGAFEMRLARGRWRIEAGTDDGRGGSSAGAAVDVSIPGDAANEVVVVLASGSTVRGVVTGAEDGNLLEGVVVRVFAFGDERWLATGRSDAEGRFSVRGVPPGIARVRFESPDRGAFALEPRVVRESDEIDLGVVALPRGVVARVELFRDGASVLPRAEVRIECDGGAVRSGRTDDYGRAVVTGLSPGGAVVRVRDESGATVRAARVDVPAVSAEWTLRLDCGSGTRVAGRVTTGGRDEPFARVLLHVAAPQAAEVSAVADAQGRYALAPVPPGDGEFEVSVAGQTTPWRRAVRVVGGDEQLVDIRLPEQSVSGRVEAFVGGDPIAGAALDLCVAGDVRPIASGVSTETGMFELRRVPAGVYDLVASRGGFGPAVAHRVVVVPGTNTIDLRVAMPPEGRVALRVRDDRWRPVSNAWATARRDGRVQRFAAEIDDSPKSSRWDSARAADVEPTVTAWASTDGVVRLSGLSRGTWRISVGASGSGRVDLGSVRVDEGERDLGDVTLPRGAALRVVATRAGAANVPVPGVAVTLLDVYSSDPRPVRRPDDVLRGADPAYVTGSDGAVEIAGLAPGVYFVGAADGRGRDDLQRVRVRAETVETVILRVPQKR
ncbi:MAG: carboxypeptidase-like regulatory domain-containing protein [Planctomycetes bacterium]|nr:carboxypeptidase-like regulatory domain-containing protein [Planctomycetota bacterium]